MNIKNIVKIDSKNISFNSRNQSNSLNKTKNTTFSSKKSTRKRFIEHNSNKFNCKKYLNFSKSQIYPNSLIYHKKEFYNKEKINNNNIKTNFSDIISKNTSSSLPNIKIPKINIQHANFHNKKSNNLPFPKNDNLYQKNRFQTQRNYIKSKSNFKEGIDEEDINKIYYKIFPKHLKEKPIEKVTIINNLYNYYCCNNNEQFEQIIDKENERRKKLKKSLIKLPLKNEESKNIIRSLKNKAFFIGNIVNYCYPKAFVYKIAQKTKQLEQKRKQMNKKYLLPTEEADLLNKKRNDKITISLINNSFNILNRKNIK